MAESYGLDVERRRREITAHHGVPDFVFRPMDVAKGKAARREIGDFLLWVDNVVAIVSHKSREPAAAATESQARRKAWFEKQVKAAHAQIEGVARRLREAPRGDILLESERGVQVPWDPLGVEAYVGVIVIDAPAPDEDYGPPLMRQGIRTIVMLADDWDVINALLPSTWSMIMYCARRAERIPRCPVGAELDIFALLIEHEQTGEEIDIPPGGLPKGHFVRVRSAHPDWFLGGHPDDRYSLVVDAMIEGAADPDPARMQGNDPLNYRRVVAFLDRIPLLTRVSIGKQIIDACERVGRDGGRASFRAAVPGGMLVFLTDDLGREERTKWLYSLTTARHSQALDAGAPDWIATVGVATQPIPSPDAGRAHDFVVIQGGIRSEPNLVHFRDELFGTVDMGPLVDRWQHRETG